MSATATTIEVRLNDLPLPAAEGSTLGDLLRGQGLRGHRGVAAAVNGSVVPRSAWDEHVLGQGDRVLVIRATQGG